MRCKGCDSEYVEETEKTKHQDEGTYDFSVKGNKKSALSTHNLRTGHTFDLDHIEVVDMEPRRDWRKVTEAFHIRLRNADINQEQGYSP